MTQEDIEYESIKCGVYDQQKEEITRLRAALEVAQKDAERYRWLRDIGDSTWSPMSKRGITAYECDAAIDSALSPQPVEKGKEAQG